jgi:hypothetical protein
MALADSWEFAYNKSHREVKIEAVATPPTPPADQAIFWQAP